MKKRALCFLTAAVLVLLLPCASPADGCEHQFRPTEWILVGYVAPQPGVPGYSGDFCCPNCGAVMQKGQEIPPLDAETVDPEVIDPDPVVEADPPAVPGSPADVGSGEQVKTPEEPAVPAEPELKVEQPSQSETPEEPEQPAQPVTQQEPEQPVTQPITQQEPEQPVTQPTTQQEPEQPVTQPATQEDPVLPAEPVQPETPAEPDQPVTLVQPAEPEQPITPEVPVQPAEPEFLSLPESPAEAELPLVIQEEQSSTDSSSAADPAPDPADTFNTGNPPKKSTARERFSGAYPYRRVKMNSEPGIHAEAAGVLTWPAAASPLQQMLRK